MGLSSDQRALLDLLLEGQDYERIAGVVGTSAGEVSRRAHEAAAALEADPSEAKSAQRVRARLRELDPGSDPAPARDAAPGGPSSRNRWLLVAIGAAAAALVALVVVITQTGGESGETTTSGPDVEEDVVVVELEPVDGSGGKGTARIIRAVADQPAIDLDVEGLAPSGTGQSYVLALQDEGGKTLPIAFRAVGENGRFTGRTIIPTAALGLLPSLDFLVVSLAGEREAAAALQNAASTESLPGEIGTTVLRGALPR